jgi:tetratricopeptide (TPR) repeat protein
MQPGDVLGAKFEIERRAGAGGMGEVFRARDRTTGEAIAIKVLLEGRKNDDARFEREADVLSDLRHPGIVQYVAHELTSAGRAYLAMEWLEGEDLATRLRRAGLTVEETITLMTRAAEALGAAHARGVVHRDLKPSNLFLVGRDVARVKVLDFGIAHLGGATRMTQTGVVLGTPGYMAPEQARSSQEIDARTDVFALGCVLFECLTGAPLFSGEHFMAIVAKILFQVAPRVRDFRPGVAPELDALVARMLAKNPAERPYDGTAVAAALESLSRGAVLYTEDAPQPSGAPSSALTGSERRVLSVVLLGPDRGGAGDAARTEELRRAVEARGGQIEFLPDGSALVTFTGSSRIATDQAAQAARCALALRALCPGRAMTLATGRAEVTGKIPVSEAIDQAARRLSTHRMPAAGLPPSGNAPPIAIDEVTAGLLDIRFEVVEATGGLTLQREHPIAEGMRTLLGKPTTCVGREWELATLEALLQESVEESQVRVALVTAPAGMGKSRLAYEFSRRARQREERVDLWVGRSDSLRAGSAFGLLGQALRSAIGFHEGEPLSQRQQTLREKVAQHVPRGERERVTEFLGELVGTPFPADAGAPLHAARLDAQLMGEQMRRAFLEFLSAEAKARPILLILEDLHWGDLPTVRFLDAALLRVKDRPWMVLALARPEVHTLFPKLWDERGVQEIRLKELTRKASERLVRQVLGDRVSAETMDRLVKQADGHAFYLEELIRAVAEGKGAALPETVLSMVQARLSGLETRARRVLRAASVFGEVLWPGGVVALLGGTEAAHEARDWLTALVEREVLVRRSESRFPGEAELGFRHALLREGAYAMLTDEDRALGHRLAAEWLEERGESGSMSLAEHFERGREPARAASHFLRAAEQAFRGGDVNAAVERAQRGLAGGPPDAVRAELLSFLSETIGWSNEMSLALSYAEQAARVSTPGSVPWTKAMSAKLAGVLYLGRVEEAMATLDALLSAVPVPDARGHWARGLGSASLMLSLGGRLDLAGRTIERIRAASGPCRETDPLTWAWMEAQDTHWAAWALEDPWTGLLRGRAAHGALLAAGQRLPAALVQALIGMDAWFLGALDEAEQELRASILTASIDNRDLGPFSSLRTRFLVGVLLDRGALGEARNLASRMIATGQEQGIPQDEGRGRWAMADVLRALGDLAAAEREAERSLEQMATLPLERAAATVTLAAIHLACGRVASALTAAREAMARYEEMRAFGFKGSFARLIYAEALAAVGEQEASRAALAVARERLLATAQKIDAPELRRRFLADIPEHARILTLAGDPL